MFFNNGSEPKRSLRKTDMFQKQILYLRPPEVPRLVFSVRSISKFTTEKIGYLTWLVDHNTQIAKLIEKQQIHNKTILRRWYTQIMLSNPHGSNTKPKISLGDGLGAEIAKLH